MQTCTPITREQKFNHDALGTHRYGGVMQTHDGNVWGKGGERVSRICKEFNTFAKMEFISMEFYYLTKISLHK